LNQNYYNQDEPRKLVRSKRFSQIAIGGTFTIGLTHGGELLGWGTDFINYGKNEMSNEPVLIDIAGGKKVISISAGMSHAAAIDEDGQVHSWGNGGSWLKGGGQLGHGTRSLEARPK
jgi:alpha-tubulin suppressor-like RCC1 family protein